ncbi:PAS domain S-box protein [Candidatus Bathyarchaeota archaeon]|nr:PAS domain S-box protein [Candidatus Bathyarchaeota archaeon]
MQSKPRRSSENNFITLLNFIADPAVIVDEKGRFLVVNDAFMDLTGLKEKELVGTAFLDLTVLSAENKAVLLKNLAKRLKGVQVEPYEIGFKNRTGETRYAEVKAKKIEYSGQSADLVVFRDITQRKENARQLTAYSEKMAALVEEKAREIIESKEKLEKVFDSSPDAIVVTDSEGKLVEVNEATVHMYECSSKDELIGKNTVDLVPQKERQKLLLIFETLAKDGAVKNVEHVSLTKQNRVFPVEFSASVIKDSSGNPIGFMGVIKDISERKKAEVKLSESESQYRTLVEQSLQGMLIGQFSPFRFVFASQPMANILGYTVDELKALSPEKIKDLIHPADLSFVLKSFRKGLLGKKVPQRFEFRMIKKSGNVCWVEIFCALTAYAGKPAVQAIFVDITERKQLEVSLRTSEEMFRAISTSAMDAIILLDDTGKITYWNPAAERIFGYTNEEAVGKKLADLVIPPQHHGIHSKTAIRDFEKGHNHKAQIETKALRKNGTEVPIELSVATLEIKDKKHMLGIIRDITERKKMEMTLREAEKRYRALFDKAPLGIMVCDETATAIEFNEEAHRQLGYTRDEFAKLTVSDYEVIETPEETRARIKKIMREGKDEFETKHRTKNGKIRDVVVAVQLIELAGKTFFHLITRDVTEQKKIERELKVERDKLEAVTENIGAGLGIISKDYRILWANKLLRQVNGDCEGKPCYSTFERRSDVCPECGVKKVFENSVPIDIHEYSSQDDKGNRFWIELIVTPIKDEKGNVIAALELAVNITERKIMENKLADYSQKLEKIVEKRTGQLKQTQAKLVKSERLATIGELAAMVGHDLRNPLTGIMGAAYYLKTKHTAELGVKGKDMLETIEKAIIYSNKIVNDLLEYSRDLKLELEDITPKELMEKAMSLIEVPEAIQVVDATEDKPTFRADAEKMRRVFVNTIKNAFDAMPDGGTLTVKSRKVKGKLEIAFKDTGTGMSKATLSKIKGGIPLFTTKAKGMGFGVPICKRIAEAHGGKLSVESKLGKGTTITITVPVNPKPTNEGEDKWIFNEFMLQTITAKQKTRQKTKQT